MRPRPVCPQSVRSRPSPVCSQRWLSRVRAQSWHSAELAQSRDDVATVRAQAVRFPGLPALVWWVGRVCTLRRFGGSSRHLASCGNRVHPAPALLCRRQAAADGVCTRPKHRVPAKASAMLIGLGLTAVARRESSLPCGRGSAGHHRLEHGPSDSRRARRRAPRESALRGQCVRRRRKCGYGVELSDPSGCRRVRCLDRRHRDCEAAPAGLPRVRAAGVRAPRRPPSAARADARPRAAGSRREPRDRRVDHRGAGNACRVRDPGSIA